MSGETILKIDLLNRRDVLRGLAVICWSALCCRVGGMQRHSAMARLFR